MDLLGFNKMFTPIVIQALYFLGLLGVLISAVFAIFTGHIFYGILVLVLGALGVRIYSELLILTFRIYDNLVEINQTLKKRDASAATSTTTPNSQF